MGGLSPTVCDNGEVIEVPCSESIVGGANVEKVLSLLRRQGNLKLMTDLQIYKFTYGLSGKKLA